MSIHQFYSLNPPINYIYLSEVKHTHTCTEMELQKECSLKEIDYPSRRNPSRHPTCVTWGLWTPGGSSIWCSEQLRRTPLASLLQPLGSPSLPSCCLGPRGPRSQGKRGTWFLSFSCLPPPPRRWVRAASARLSAVRAAVSSQRLRVAVSSSSSTPPGAADGYSPGCPHLLRPF